MVRLLDLVRIDDFIADGVINSKDGAIDSCVAFDYNANINVSIPKMVRLIGSVG